MQFIDDCFCDFPGFVQQAQIRGIGDVFGTGGDVKDDVFAAFRQLLLIAQLPDLSFICLHLLCPIDLALRE